MTTLHGSIPLDHKAALPVVGHTYIDCDRRRFRVETLSLSDPLGREVVGFVFVEPGTFHEGQVEHGVPYSTTLKTWAHIWRDKHPGWIGRG